MIAPQPGQPGVIGQQHGLQRLTETLERIEKGQRIQETRDAEIRSQLTDQTARMTQLTRRMQRQGYAIAGLSAGVLLLVGLVGWQLTHQPEMRYSHALGAIDIALVQTWGTLPKGTQEQLSATYSRLGLASPGKR